MSDEGIPTHIISPDRMTVIATNRPLAEHEGCGAGWTQGFGDPRRAQEEARALLEVAAIPRCGTCRFWVGRHEYTDVGECRRRAPIDGPGGMGDWPNTRVVDWCGEHEKARAGR